jgi:hypothetical protein
LKKFIFLLVTLVGLTSCSSNDDDATLNADAIIGTWQLESNVEAGTERSTPCTRQSTITFLANGNSTNVDVEDSTNNDCESNNSTFNWENTGDANYKLDFGNGQIQTLKFTFSENNSKFSIVLKEGVVNGQTLQEISTYKKI